MANDDSPIQVPPLCAWTDSRVRFRALPAPDGGVRVEFSTIGRDGIVEAERAGGELFGRWTWQFDAAVDAAGFLSLRDWHAYDEDVDRAKARLVGRAQYELAVEREAQHAVRAAQRRAAAATSPKKGPVAS